MTMRPFFAIVAVLAISGLEFAASVEPNNDGNHVLIAKYTAQALVTDLLSIDLDLQAMEKQLNIDNTTYGSKIAHQVYTEGSHSMSIATLRLAQPLSTALSKGTLLSGESDYNREITGTLFREAFVGDVVLEFQYHVSSEENDPKCYVGGRAIENQVTNGCLTRQGTVKVDDGTLPAFIMAYEYNPYSDNDNGMTLQNLSLNADRKMYECSKCPYHDFLKFREYYGSSSYADDWVTAAFAGTKTTFRNGNADFDLLGLEGRAEAIKKGVASMHVWMAVIGKMEEALDFCQTGCFDCNAESVLLWDEAVALYTGSLQGEDGSGFGLFPYSLADKRCQDFRTCGKYRAVDAGISAVNIEIFQLFQTGQLDIRNSACAIVRDHKERIVNLMSVPLVQGTLRYAYILDRQGSGDKELGEGAAYAASVLPLVHYCAEYGPEDAQFIWEQMAVSTEGTDFAKVKEAFERHYECMGITCSDVGGIYNAETGVYYKDASPCIGFEQERKTAVEIVVIVLGVLVGIVLITCCCLPCRRRKIIKKGEDMPAAAQTAQELGDEGDTTETVTLGLYNAWFA